MGDKTWGTAYDAADEALFGRRKNFLKRLLLAALVLGCAMILLEMKP